MKNILFIFLFLFYSATQAQDLNRLKSENLTVERAVKLAIENNPQINKVRQKIKSKDAQIWLSSGIQTPQLSFMKEGISNNSNVGFEEKRWTFSQSLDFPLTGYFRTNKTATEKKVYENQLEADIYSLKSQVKKVYANIAYALEIIDLRNEEIRLAQELRNAATTRFEVGESSELELMRADIQLAEAENALSDANKLLHEARYNLFKLIGLDPDEQTYNISFPDTLHFFTANINEDDVTALLENQPEYKGSIENIKAATFGVKEAWSSFLPDIEFQYYRQNYGLNFDSYGYEIGFKIPLWFAFDQKSKIQMAKAEQRSLTFQQREVKLDLKHQIEIAWHSYETSLEKIDRYDSLIKSRARNLLILTLEGYRAGELDILALLEAQRTFLNSEKNYLDALHDYYLRLIDLEKFLQKDIVFQDNN
jgi:outer membrane protein, heavy metal efflux system